MFVYVTFVYDEKGDDSFVGIGVSLSVAREIAEEYLEETLTYDGEEHPYENSWSLRDGQGDYRGFVSTWEVSE